MRRELRFLQNSVQLVSTLASRTFRRRLLGVPLRAGNGQNVSLFREMSSVEESPAVWLGSCLSEPTAHSRTAGTLTFRVGQTARVSQSP